MRGIGSVRRYDCERNQASIDVMQLHFLKGRNQGKSSSQKT